MRQRFRTALLTSWFALLAFAPSGPPSIAATLLVQWMLFAFVWWSDPSLVRSLFRSRRLLRDLLLGIAFCGLLLFLDRFFPHSRDEQITIAIAVTAGVCEEVVFRGYLQRQYALFLGSRFAAILLQAILFAAVHPGARLEVFVIGVLLGILARKARSLRPGIVCHLLIDLLSAG
jgi:membrane protease YdiL (CAAX protease family)